jgi:hypothetical protein
LARYVVASRRAAGVTTFPERSFAAALSSIESASSSRPPGLPAVWPRHFQTAELGLPLIKRRRAMLAADLRRGKSRPPALAEPRRLLFRTP